MVCDRCDEKNNLLVDEDGKFICPKCFNKKITIQKRRLVEIQRQLNIAVIHRLEKAKQELDYVIDKLKDSLNKRR